MNHLTTEVIEVTPAQAKSWLENNLYPRQRPVRKEHVSFLAEQMSKNQFISGTQVYFTKLDSDLYLVDGQHRLNAIARSGITLSMVVTINHVNNKNDTAWLYTAFDRQLTRKISDAIKAVQPAGVDEWKAWEINTFAGALSLACMGFTGHRKVGFPEILFGLDDWAVYARQYFEAIIGADKDVARKLRRRTCVAVGMSTFRFAEDASLPHNFWVQVAEDDGLMADDARKQLHKRLITLDIPSPGSTIRISVNETYIIKLCTIAWNAYVEQRPMGKLPISKGQQYPILHTPFNFSKTTKEYREMYDNGYKDYDPNMPQPVIDV